MDTETWSYTILGNSTGSKIYGAFIDIIIASLTPEEINNLSKILTKDKYLKDYIEKCYDTLVSYAFKTESRLGFQALGVFLMKHGAKMTTNLKKLVLKYSKWKDECRQFNYKKDRAERKKFLFDFREKVLLYETGKKTKVFNETVEDIAEKKEAINDNTPVWRQSLDHRIKDLKEDIKNYFNIHNLEFKVNDYITLKLEGGKTYIYINEENFIICKYVFIDIPIEKAESIDKRKSIDEYTDSYNDASFHLKDDSTYIPLNLEFWVHCSNMQVWAENHYDSRLLHSNLSFPLLKKLTEVGDPVANKVYKEEIAKRFESGYTPVMNFLVDDGYIKYLENNELGYLIDYLNELIEKNKEPSKRNSLLKIRKKMNNYFV